MAQSRVGIRKADLPQWCYGLGAVLFLLMPVQEARSEICSDPTPSSIGRAAGWYERQAWGIGVVALEAAEQIAVVQDGKYPETPPELMTAFRVGDPWLFPNPISTHQSQDVNSNPGWGAAGHPGQVGYVWIWSSRNRTNSAVITVFGKTATIATLLARTLPLDPSLPRGARDDVLATPGN